MPYVTSVERNALERGQRQGKKEGKKEGRQEGSLRTARDMLLEALEAKFNTVPKEIQDRIQNLNEQPKLKSLHREAVLSKDLSDFSRKLE